MPQAAIFDVDGTLLDSVDLHAIAWHEALAKFGHEVSFAQVRDQIGEGGDNLIPVFLSPKSKMIMLEKWKNGAASISGTDTCR